MPHDVFEGKAYKYLLSGVDFASRHGVAKSVTTKKSSEIAFMLRQSIRKVERSNILMPSKLMIVLSLSAR